MFKKEIDTPAILVDYDIMHNNLKKMAEAAREGGVDLRPHIKTHKTPEIAGLQRDYGSRGITVAKVGEAEVMVKSGFDDILIAYPLVKENKIKRMYKLADRARIISGVDSFTGARILSEFAGGHNTVFEVMLIVDTGLERCGVKPDREGIETARMIDNLPGVKIIGVFTHEGHVYGNPGPDHEIRKLAREAAQTMVKFGARLREEEIDANIISVGSTPTAAYNARVKGITEIRPGTYVFNDMNEVNLGVAEVEDCALTVLSTVISKPSTKRVVIDAGSKSLTADRGISRGFGYLKRPAGLNLEVNRVSEEHGIINLNGDKGLNIGDSVEIVPNHVCPVVNLFDRLYVIKDEKVKDVWRVRARGKVT